jgi:hypothetical protein
VDFAVAALRVTCLSLGKIVGYLASAALIFLGIIFLLASVYAVSRLLVGTILVMAGLGIALLTWKAGASQAPVKYELQMPSSLKVGSIKCPNCGAGLDPSSESPYQLPSQKVPGAIVFDDLCLMT